MTENDTLSRDLLSFLGSSPKTLKDEGHAAVGKLAVQLGNMALWMSYQFEKGKPQLYQPINEPPQSLYALGKQLREVGLELWDAPPSKEKMALQRELAAIQTRLQRLEIKEQSKGGGK